MQRRAALTAALMAALAAALMAPCALGRTQVGAAKCVWADGFAMETIATHYQLLLLVVDERSTQKFTRISPQSLGENGMPNASGGSLTCATARFVMARHLWALAERSLLAARQL